MNSKRIIIGIIYTVLVMCVSFKGKTQELGKTYALTDKSFQADTAKVLKLIKQGQKAINKTPDSTLIILKEAMTISRRINFTRGITETFINEGRAYTRLGMYQKALEQYKEAMPYAIKANDSANLLSTYISLSNVYTYMGNHKQSIDILYKAAAIIEHSSKKRFYISKIYNSLSSNLIEINQIDKALYYLNIAEKTTKEDTNHMLYSYVLNNKGIAYSKKNDLQKAEACFKTAYKIGEQYNLANVLTSTAGNLSNLYTTQGDFKKAMPYLKLSGKTDKLKDAYYQRLALHNMGMTYFEQKDYKKAEEYLLQSIAMGKKDSIGANLLPDHNLLQELYARTGRYKEAYEHQKAILAIKDTLMNSEAVKINNQLEVRYRTSEKDKDIMQKQLLIAQQNNKLKNRDLWIGSISAGAILLILLSISLYRTYRHRQNLQEKRMQILMQEHDLLQQRQEIDQLQAAMAGEEQERARIAKELHDGIMVQFSVVKMSLSTLTYRHRDIPYIKDFEETVKQLDTATRELRRTAHNLMPDVLVQDGLKEALHFFCANLQESAPVNINFQWYGELPRLDAGFELSVYRVIQELAHNIIKHADATNALIQVIYQSPLLTITIEDDGKGISEKALQGDTGMGLKSIRTRITTMNGKIDIRSHEQKGTTIFIEFNISPLVNKTVTA